MTKKQDEELLKEIEEERLINLEIERDNLLCIAIALTIVGLFTSLGTIFALLC